MRTFFSSSSSSSFSLLTISLSLLYLFITSHGAPGRDLIQETCKTCSQKDPNIRFGFCTSALQAAPASGCAPLSGLGRMSIRLVRDNVTDARCHVKQLLKNKKLEPHVKACLEDCLELYSDALDSAKEATKHYNARQYEDANVKLSSVMDAATTCQDGFMEMKAVVSPLTKRNNDTFQLSAMALSIMGMIQSGSL